MFFLRLHFYHRWALMSTSASPAISRRLDGSAAACGGGPCDTMLEEGPIAKLCDERYVCGSKPLAFTTRSHFRIRIIEAMPVGAFTRIHKISWFVLADTTRLAPARLWRSRGCSAPCSPFALGFNRGKWPAWGNHGARRHSSDSTTVGIQSAARSEALASRLAKKAAAASVLPTNGEGCRAKCCRDWTRRKCDAHQDSENRALTTSSSRFKLACCWARGQCWRPPFVLSFENPDLFHQRDEAPLWRRCNAQIGAP